jgi:putative membrane protein
MIALPVAATIAGMHYGEFIPPLAACAVYLFLYQRRARTLAREGRPVPRWRQLSFAGGALLTVAVQVGPADTLADEVLFTHMLQHIILGDICSLFIVLGLTGPVMQPLLHIRTTRVLRVLSHPIVAVVLWAADLYAWHLPVAYQLAIRIDLVHALEHACFLWFGSLLWLALIGPLPKPSWFKGWSEFGAILAVRTLGAILSNVLIWAQTVLYPVYKASDAARGLNPLSDQNAAGGVMMIEQTILTIVLFVWLFYRWARRQERAQQLLDLALRSGVELSEERAERAAYAGADERLRQRILGSAAEPPDG